MSFRQIFMVFAKFGRQNVGRGLMFSRMSYHITVLKLNSVWVLILVQFYKYRHLSIQVWIICCFRMEFRVIFDVSWSRFSEFNDICSSGPKCLNIKMASKIYYCNIYKNKEHFEILLYLPLLQCYRIYFLNF